ncbi:hypothetical protein B484DRAFT_447717 [Ochromonadaceae sp. CCMP2298]|nr:hypothetical protein B484DRAFT_447717 [Ochromonadaceae sp. CCMP2298]
MELPEKTPVGKARRGGGGRDPYAPQQANAPSARYDTATPGVGGWHADWDPDLTLIESTPVEHCYGAPSSTSFVPDTEMRPAPPAFSHPAYEDDLASAGSRGRYVRGGGRARSGSGGGERGDNNNQLSSLFHTQEGGEEEGETAAFFSQMRRFRHAPHAAHLEGVFPPGATPVRPRPPSAEDAALDALFPLDLDRPYDFGAGAHAQAQAEVKRGGGHGGAFSDCTSPRPTMLPPVRRSGRSAGAGAGAASQLSKGRSAVVAEAAGAALGAGVGGVMLSMQPPTSRPFGGKGALAGAESMETSSFFSAKGQQG